MFRLCLVRYGSYPGAGRYFADPKHRFQIIPAEPFFHLPLKIRQRLVVEEKDRKGAFHKIRYRVPQIVSLPPGIRYSLTYPLKICS